MSLDVAALYECHWDDIYRFLRRRMLGAADAEVEDVTAMVFEKVCRFSDRYDPQHGSAQSWLYQVARNVQTDHVRAQAIRPISCEITTDAPGGRATVDAGTDPQIDALVVADALLKLSPRYRLVIVERFLMGATHAETACMLHVSADAVRHLQERALRILRKHLAA